MTEIMGLAVPKVKASASHDTRSASVHHFPMQDDDDNPTEQAWREGFRQRVRSIQGNRTQEQMAMLLGISREAYSKYVGSRKSLMPHRLLPKLAALGEMSVEELILGRNESPNKEIKPSKKRHAS